MKIFCSFLSYRFDYLPSTELSKKIFFLNKPNERVTLQVSPAVPEGTAHQWMWTSHDGRHSNTSVAQITSSRNRNPSWNTQAPFSKGTGYDLSIQTKFENAGEFVFMQTKPASVIVMRFQVFAFKGIVFQNVYCHFFNIRIGVKHKHVPFVFDITKNMYWICQQGCLICKC